MTLGLIFGMSHRSSYQPGNPLVGTLAGYEHEHPLDLAFSVIGGPADQSTLSRSPITGTGHLSAEQTASQYRYSHSEHKC